MVFIIKETIVTYSVSEVTSKVVTNLKAFLYEEDASDYLDVIAQDYRDDKEYKIVRDEDDHFEVTFDDVERCETNDIVIEIDRVNGAGE